MLASGMHAPDFELNDLAGGRVRLSGLLERAPVLLAFFKVSCPVCQLTFPYLERLAKNEGVQIVGISQNDAKATRGFNDKYGVTFPTLVDEAAEGYIVSNAFGISSVPSIFVVETDGRVSAAFSGFSKRDLEMVGRRVNIA